MDVGVLGALEVRGHAGQLVAVPGHRQRALLALLALRPGSVSPAERLIDDLWSEVPLRQPANALQVIVFKLRKAIGGDVVETRPPGYVLHVDHDDVDGFRFERLATQGRQELEAGRHDHALAMFDEARGLWRDSALLQFLDMPTAYAAATRWEELRAALVEDRFDTLLDMGRSGELVAELTQAISDAPYRERLRYQLMLALYRAGRQAEALKVFGDTRRVLADELGLDPGPELRALESAILSHDPTLDAVARTRAVVSAAAEPPMTVGDVSGEVSRPAPVGPPLIGRAAELAMLSDQLVALGSDRGSVTLIGGEPGIGKSRLVAETAQRATAAGAVVVWGRCHPSGGAPAFWPWSQVVGGALDRFDSDVIKDALRRRGASDLSQLVPEIKELYDELLPPATADADTTRFRTYDALTKFVRRLAADTPIVVVLDDLHWADRASLDVIGLLAADLADVPLMVLGTYRTLPAPSGHLAEALVDIGRHPSVRRVQLDGLAPDAIAQLLSDRSLQLDEGEIAAMHQRTRGNPFFVTEIARLLEDGDAGDRARIHTLVPASVRDVIEQRVGQLPEATVELLSAAAVAGPDVDLVLLAGVIGVAVAHAVDIVEPAVDAGLLVGVGRHAARFRFAHGLVNETIYAGLRPGTRAALHLRVARGLRSQRGEAWDSGLLTLADHYLRAAPLAPPDETVEAAVAAGRWATTHVAHAQAEQTLRSALEVIGTLPDGAERRTHELALLNDLSTLLIVGGGDPLDLERISARMEALSESVDDPHTLGALWRLSVYRSSLLQLDRAIEIGNQLLRVGEARGDPTLTLAGLIAVGPPHMMRGEFDIADQYLGRALDACNAGVDRGLRGLAMESPRVLVRNFAAVLAAIVGDTDRAEWLVGESIAVGEEEGPTSFALAVATGFAAWVSALLGDAPTAAVRSSRAAAIGAEGGHEVRIVTTPIHGWALAMLGQPQAGVEELDSADYFFERSKIRLFGSFRCALLADALLAAGDIARVMEITEIAVREADDTGERWCQAELHRARARAHVALGDRAAARSELEQALEIASQQGAGTFVRRAQSMLAELGA